MNEIILKLKELAKKHENTTPAKIMIEFKELIHQLENDEVEK